MAAVLATSASPVAELDEVSLERARRGDDCARRQLIVHYQDRVFRFLWRMLACRGQGALAEDLCQETFERVLRALPAFSTAGPARLSTWILTIATRLALKELRRGRVREDARTAAPIDAEPLPGPDQQIERAALGRAVRSAIARLRPDHRAVIILREYYNVVSKADPVGHPAADCVEKAVLSAARFAPSSRVTGVPVRLSLQPTR